jgi:hypothetical protein
MMSMLQMTMRSIRLVFHGCCLSLVWRSVAVVAQQDPTTMNGGSILAMSGKECVAVAVDKRFGSGSQVRYVPYADFLLSKSLALFQPLAEERHIQHDVYDNAVALHCILL